VQGAVRHFSLPPPPPAGPVLEELFTYRVREKLQGELRQDRQELLNKIDSAVKSVNDKVGGVERSLNDKLGTNFQAMNTKIDSTKLDISLHAGGYALGGATLALSGFGFFFGKKVDVVDVKQQSGR
jgi:hypothetical protein